MVIATGILNVWMHTAAEVGEWRAGLDDADRDRLLLGIGISHAPLIDAQPGMSWERPLATTRAYLDAMDEAGIPVDARCVAALGPKMLELARDRSAGAHPYLVTPEHTARARDTLGAGALLAVEQGVVLETEPDRARDVARQALGIYATLPNYVNNWKRLGFTDDDAASLSDRLVDALIAWGDPDTVADRVQAHRDAGADHVCVQVIASARESVSRSTTGAASPPPSSEAERGGVARIGRARARGVAGMLPAVLGLRHPHQRVCMRGREMSMSESSSAHRRGRGARRGLAAAILVVVVATAACTTAPAQPVSGPGSNTPCGRTDVQLTNPGATANAIYVAYPTGTSAAPLTGGTCGDANRPVLFLVHGYLASFNWVYEGVINHFTRSGNIVVMGTYGTDLADVQGSADRALQALNAAVPQLEREDLSNVGLVGHSLGGGVLPWITQQVAAQGWGSEGLWLFSLAPYQGIGGGPIALPAHTRAVIEAYDGDTLVDRNVGVDLFRRLSIPDSQKDHVTVRSSSNGGASLTAQHTSPNSVIAPDDAIKFYGIYRIGDLLQSCALLGVNCQADLSLMGSWSDGTPVLRSVVTDSP